MASRVPCYKPSQNDLSDELLGADVVEVSGLTVIELIHHVQHGVTAEDLVRDVRAQHHARLVLQDGGNEPRHHLQSVNKHKPLRPCCFSGSVNLSDCRLPAYRSVHVHTWLFSSLYRVVILFSLRLYVAFNII